MGCENFITYTGGWGKTSCSEVLLLLSSPLLTGFCFMGCIVAFICFVHSFFYSCVVSLVVPWVAVLNVVPEKLYNNVKCKVNDVGVSECGCESSLSVEYRVSSIAVRNLSFVDRFRI